MQTVPMALSMDAVELVRRACDAALTTPNIRKDIMSANEDYRRLLRQEVLQYLEGRWSAISPGHIERPGVPKLPEDHVWWEVVTPANGVIRVANHTLPDTNLDTAQIVK